MRVVTFQRDSIILMVKETQGSLGTIIQSGKMKLSLDFRAPSMRLLLLTFLPNPLTKAATSMAGKGETIALLVPSFLISLPLNET